MYRLIGKRVFDFCFSIISLSVLIPFFILVGIFIKLDSKGPVFFTQFRLGKNKKQFKVIKFRSMTNSHRKTEQQVFNGNPEITRVGFFLRRFKIDEMPQIFNVLKGDMSIIGPRPCLPATIEKYGLEETFRFRVKPGLSSIAGVNGSIHLSWKEKWHYDKYYVENLSFLLDVKIIIKTIMVVFLGEERFIKRPELSNDGTKKV